MKNLRKMRVEIKIYVWQRWGQIDVRFQPILVDKERVNFIPAL